MGGGAVATGGGEEDDEDAVRERRGEGDGRGRAEYDAPTLPPFIDQWLGSPMGQLGGVNFRTTSFASPIRNLAETLMGQFGGGIRYSYGYTYGTPMAPPGGGSVLRGGGPGEGYSWCWEGGGAGLWVNGG